MLCMHFLLMFFVLMMFIKCVMLFRYVFMILWLVFNGFQLIFWDCHTLLLILINFLVNSCLLWIWMNIFVFHWYSLLVSLIFIRFHWLGSATANCRIDQIGNYHLYIYIFICVSMYDMSWCTCLGILLKKGYIVKTDPHNGDRIGTEGWV